LNQGVDAYCEENREDVRPDPLGCAAIPGL
jgi:hypothetical protein